MALWCLPFRSEKQYNSLFRSKYWVHKKWSGIWGKLVVENAFFFPDLLEDAFVIPSYWGNTGGRLLIHSAAYVTLLMQEVAVNMIQLQELGLHEEILGNYCIATFDQSLYPHQNLWEDFQCLCVIFLNTR